MRTLSRVLTLGVVAVCVLASSPVLAQSEEAEKKAVAAATAWLALVDAGRYAESWDAAAAYFKNAVSQDNWVKMLEGARKPLGKLISRKLAAKKYATSLPGAPDGQYVVIQFSAEFAAKAKAVETVTPMLDGDGVWRVSGYFIK